MTATYRIEVLDTYDAERRAFQPAFEVQYVRTYRSGSRTLTLATYSTRAAAELVVSALRAAQNDLT